MSKKSSDETKYQRDNSLDWTYWNRIPVLELEQAILLTVNWTPRATRKFLDVCDYSAFYPPRYHEILAIAQAHILDGSLKYINQFEKNLRTVDWLQWLKTIGITPPNEWRPIDPECPAPKSTESANTFDPHYRSHYAEAVDTAVAMAESADSSTPTQWKELIGYMMDHPNKCPVNCGGDKTPKASTIERNVRAGGGNPLKDDRFRKIIAQNC